MAIIPVSQLRAPKIPLLAQPAQAAHGAPGLNGGANKHASGMKTYGLGHIGTATSGPVDKTGYITREQKRQMRQLAMQNVSLPSTAPNTLGAVA